MRKDTSTCEGQNRCRPFHAEGEIDLRRGPTVAEYDPASSHSRPDFDKGGGFWFGSFSDPEGNPSWVVDKNCP